MRFELSDNRACGTGVECVFDFGISVAKELNMEVVLGDNLKKLEILDCFKPQNNPVLS